MPSNLRPTVLPRVRLALLLGIAAAFGGCSLFQSDAPPPAKKKGWTLLPWGGSSRVTDATPYLEYQRTRSHDAEPLLTLLARNTHPTRTIEGRMRTSMQISPGDLKVDSQSFTLAPNEQKRLLIYPARFVLTYEVTASFRE